MNKKLSKDFVVFITKLENGSFHFLPFNYFTGEEILSQSREIKDLLKFFDNPSEFLKNVKGFVCNNYKKDGTPDYDFNTKLLLKLKNLGIPIRFMRYIFVATISTFINAKLEPKTGEEILLIFVQHEIFKILLFSRQELGYTVLEHRVIPKNYDPKILLGESKKPDKIFLSNAIRFFPSAKIPMLQHVLSEWNPTVLEGHVWNYLGKGISQIVDQMLDESNNKYFVFPQCFDELGITFCNSTSIKKEDILVKSILEECLPISKSCIVSRFHKKFYIISTLKNKHKILQSSKTEISKEGHRFKLTLSVDLSSHPTITYEPIILSKIKKMPKKLKIEKTEKTPVIGFFDNSSVICVWEEENNCYRFLDSWNGKFGKELFLDFLCPKPTLKGSSEEVKSLSGAVYDLIKIMSMKPDEIQIDRSWKFTVTKDDENPVLLEFESEIPQKQASPTFLMALMLKEHLKVIKKEIGEKPKKLSFRLLDDFESPEARKRVESGLEEACEMLKIGFLLA